jgi:serine/threonine protein kinase
MNSKANVLIDKDGRARLTDFGLTSIPRGEDSTRNPHDLGVASTTWAAPEILEGGAVTEPGDVFTFAMITIEVRKCAVFDESPSTYLPRTGIYRASPVP